MALPLPNRGKAAAMSQVPEEKPAGQLKTGLAMSVSKPYTSTLRAPGTVPPLWRTQLVGALAAAVVNQLVVDSCCS